MAEGTLGFNPFVNPYEGATPGQADGTHGNAGGNGNGNAGGNGNGNAGGNGNGNGAGGNTDPNAVATTAVVSPETYSVEYVHTDALGSPVSYTSSTGSVLPYRNTRYEPYGTPTNTPRDGEPTYTGHQYDTGTGLIYAQARYYDPALGRFLSPDPMAVDTSSAFNWNRYAYANNSPYRFTDPDGRDAADRLSDAMARDPQAFNNPIHQVPAVIITAVMLAPVAMEVGAVAFANSPALTQAAITGSEIAAGDALGGATIAAGATKAVEGAYEIVDGVRRSKAAEMLGRSVIDAVDTTGKKITASIESLFSPSKDKIDVSSSGKMDRFMRVLEGVKSEKTPPILVTPGSRGTPIKDVVLDPKGE